VICGDFWKTTVEKPSNILIVSNIMFKVKYLKKHEGLNPFLKILAGVFLLLVLSPHFFAVTLKIFSANSSYPALILKVLEIRRVIEGSWFVITDKYILCTN
jgi:hypothetical protein